MRLVGGLVGGVGAGLLGAIVWAAVVYFTHYEIGIIAWGIGILVGFGAMLGSRREGGPALGAAAAVTAVGAILLGKWMLVSLTLGSSFNDDFMISEVADIILEERLEANQPVPPLRSAEESGSYEQMYPQDVWLEAKRRWNAYSAEEQSAFRRAPSMLNADLPLVYMADEICFERMDAGQTIEWPGEHTIETAWRQAHYPEYIWAETMQRWDAYSPDEQDQFVAWVWQEQEQYFLALTSGLQPMFFFQSFALFDIIWVLLALGSAFQLASSCSEKTRDSSEHHEAKR
ncbi:MAG: hypothetical protein EA377_13020 [Phycisphaerales bacterium]|nr:MAG: hypothetical protein EA377_13020 [Phycisphaerales bacterium]